MNTSSIEYRNVDQANSFADQIRNFPDLDIPLLIPHIKNETKSERAERILQKIKSSSNHLEKVFNVLNRVNR